MLLNRFKSLIIALTLPLVIGTGLVLDTHFHELTGSKTTIQAPCEICALSIGWHQGMVSWNLPKIDCITASYSTLVLVQLPLNPFLTFIEWESPRGSPFA